MFSFFFSPSGRIGRAQWWGIQLSLIVILGFVAYLIYADFAEASFAKTSVSDSIGLILSNLGKLGLALVVCTWINFCGTVKRYHDRGKSGFWFLLNFAPLGMYFIGLESLTNFASAIVGIWTIVECGCLSGNQHDNDYGPAQGGSSPYQPQFDTPEMASGDGGLPNRYDRAIEEAVLANRQSANTQTVTSYQQPQQFYQPSNNRPVFGKRT